MAEDTTPSNKGEGNKMKKTALEKLFLGLLFTAFVALSVYYIFGNPLYCKPDEVYHQAYVEHLMAGQGLPKIDVKRASREKPTPVELEGHQPPFYYATVAGTATLFNLKNLYPPTPNPHFLATDYGNYNVFVPVYLFSPFKQQTLFYAGRCISLLWGTITLAATYLLIRRFFPWQLAALTVAFMGLNPQYLFIATSFSNDMAAVGLIHVALWQLGIALKAGLSYRRGALLGLIIGIATLTKLTGLGLLAPLACIAFWQVWETRQFQPLGAAVLAGSVTLGVDSWWFLRNWRLYHNPFATNLLTVLIGERTTPLHWPEIQEFLAFLWKAYWLDFSVGGIVFAAPWFYCLMGVLCIGGVVGTGVIFSRKPTLRPLLLLLWGWLGLVFVSLLKLTTETAIWMGGGRLLFPAAATVALTLAVGLREVLRSQIFVGILATLLGVYAALAPSLYLYPTYPKPIPPSHVPQSPPHRTDVNFADTFLLLGYDLAWTEKETGEAGLNITYYWRVTQTTSNNFSLFIHLYTEPEGTPYVLSQVDTYPRYGSLPTSVWLQDQLLIDQIELPIPEMNPSTQAKILTGLYYYPTMDRLPAAYLDGPPLPHRALSLAEIHMDAAGNLTLVITEHEDNQ